MHDDHLPEIVRDAFSDAYARTRNVFNKRQALDRAHTIIKLAERDGWLCQFCKETLTIKTAHLDHKIPRRQGGSNALPNLQLAHKRCNEKDGNRRTTQRGLCERCDSPLDVLRGRLCQSCREQTRNRGREQSDASLFIDRIISRATNQAPLPVPPVYGSDTISDLCEAATQDTALHALCVLRGCACSCHATKEPT